MGRQLGAVLTVAFVLLASCSDGDDGGGADGDAASATTEAGATTTLPAASTTAAAAAGATTTALAVDAKVSTGGLGAVRIGAQPDAAAEAAGTAFVDEGAGIGPSACHYVTAAGVNGVRFMVADGMIVRIDIDAGPIETISGAHIGSTRDDIIGLFGDKITAEAHPADPAGELLVFVPADAAEADRRVVFETDGSGTVVRYRTGRVPEVLYVEGCNDASA